MTKHKLIYSELTYKINGILFRVAKKLGRYRNEKQYGDAIEESLKEERISYEREKFLPESFAGEVKHRNKVDFLIEDRVILEVKAKPFITKSDYYQTMRYLKSLNKKLAILVNMRRYVIAPKRILNKDANE